MYVLLVKKMGSSIVRNLVDKKILPFHDANYSLFYVLLNSAREK